MRIPNTSKEIALDTCVIRSMMENPNYADMVFQRIDLHGVSVHICRTVAHEARGQDMDLDLVVAKLEGRGATVVFGDITARMRANAVTMLGLHEPLLHYPDNHILAYAKVLGLVLLTRDRKLETVAEKEDVGVINPDKLCGTDRRTPSRFEGTVAAHSRRSPPDHPTGILRKRRRRNLPRRASPLRA